MRLCGRDQKVYVYDGICIHFAMGNEDCEDEWPKYKRRNKEVVPLPHTELQASFPIS